MPHFYRLRLVAPFLLALASAVHAQDSAPRITPQQLREDLAQFRAEYVEGDRSFTADARRRAESRLTALERAVDTVSLVAFELELARVAALADNGHSGVFPMLRSRRHDRIPLRLALLGPDFVVLRARSPHHDLLGARVVAIDGQPVTRARDSARTLVGGTVERRDGFAPFLLESPAQMHAMGIASRPGEAAYRFALADGRTIERRIAADPADTTASTHAAARWIFPDPAVGDGDGWQSVRPSGEVPWALQEPTVPFRWRHDAADDVMVIELRQNRGTSSHPIQPFLDETEREIRSRRPRHLVLDMRLNGGGNLQLTRDWVKRLPSLVPGRLFALTSRWTFSAAISTVGYLEQEAPERVAIVGETIGDRLEFWAEGGPIRLRHTGIMLGRSLERHDYANGCREYSDCHGVMVQFPIAVRSLAPDIAAPWTVAALHAGRDPAMDAVRAAIRGERAAGRQGLR